MPPYLPDALITELYNATVDSGLLANRAALLQNIPARYWSIFPIGGGLGPQVLIDLGKLNRDGALDDGSVPFRKWLRNARDLVGPGPQLDVYERAIQALDRALEGTLRDGVADLLGALAPWNQDDLGNVLRRLPTRAAGLRATPADALALVMAASGGQWLDQLLVAALAQRLGDVDVVRLANQHGLIAPFVPQRANRPLNYERILKHQKVSQDIGVWRAKLFQAEVAVARVEMKIDDQWKAAGTAFLVAPDLVMTNYHVVAPLLPSVDASVAEELRFRFDYKRTTDGSTLLEGRLVAPADKWHVISASPSEVDEMADCGDRQPGDNELDFAVVRLAASVGSQPVGALDSTTPGPIRRWLRPSADTALTLLADGESVFILQHPGDAPLQIAAGTILDVSKRRVRYDTNTDNGSSGSPCLDARLDVVALHHAGDPNYSELHKPTYNQGIPMHLIVELCKAKGILFPDPSGI